MLLAIFLTVVLKILIMTNILSIASTSKIVSVFLSMFLMTIQFNVVFSIFNLIPLPPLDGSKVLFYFLPSKMKGIMYTLERYSFLIIMIIFVTNIASVIISPAYSLVLKFLNFILTL